MVKKQRHDLRGVDEAGCLVNKPVASGRWRLPASKVVTKVVGRPKPYKWSEL